MNNLRITRSCDGGWLAWRATNDFWSHVPMWIQEGIISAWNPIVCFFKGHKVVGSLGNSTCTHCYHCCKDTQAPCPACTILDAGGTLNGE